MKTREIFIFGLIILSSAACSHKKVKSILGPDGKENEVIDCGFDDIEVCYDRARKACGGNYQIINTNREAGEPTQILVECESGHLAYPNAKGKKQWVYGPPTQQQAEAQVTANSESSNSDSYPNAKTFADCDDLGTFEKSDCRNAVYKRAHPNAK